MNTTHLNATRDINRNLKRWEEAPSFETFLYVRDSYWQLITQTYYVGIEDYYIQYAPRIFEVFQKANQPIPTWYSTKLLDLLYDKTKLSKYLAHEKSIDGLAWFCMQRSMLHSYNSTETRKSEFRELLTNWTGVEIGQDVELSTAFVSTLLYGQHCWDLYGVAIHENLDGELLQQIVDDICHLRLPFAFHGQQETQTAVQKFLPEDLSI